MGTPIRPEIECTADEAIHAWSAYLREDVIDLENHLNHWAKDKRGGAKALLSLTDRIELRYAADATTPIDCVGLDKLLRNYPEFSRDERLKTVDLSVAGAIQSLVLLRALIEEPDSKRRTLLAWSYAQMRNEWTEPAAVLALRRSDLSHAGSQKSGHRQPVSKLLMRMKEHVDAYRLGKELGFEKACYLYLGDSSARRKFEEATGYEPTAEVGRIKFDDGKRSFTRSMRRIERVT